MNVLRSITLVSALAVGCGGANDDVGQSGDGVKRARGDGETTQPDPESGGPRVVPGNPSSCEAAGAGTGLLTFKIDPAKSGTYTTPDGRVTVTIDASEKVFSFTASAGLRAVVVKGGPAANVYVFDGEVTRGSALVAPANKGLSHIDICYPKEPAPPTKPPPETTEPDPEVIR